VQTQAPFFFQKISVQLEPPDLPEEASWGDGIIGLWAVAAFSAGGTGPPSAVATFRVWI
jgi:hypothetical protein